MTKLLCNSYPSNPSKKIQKQSGKAKRKSKHSTKVLFEQQAVKCTKCVQPHSPFHLYAVETSHCWQRGTSTIISDKPANE